jgi:hypothetical protein
VALKIRARLEGYVVERILTLTLFYTILVKTVTSNIKLSLKKSTLILKGVKVHILIFEKEREG